LKERIYDKQNMDKSVFGKVGISKNRKIK